ARRPGILASTLGGHLSPVNRLMQRSMLHSAAAVATRHTAAPPRLSPLFSYALPTRSPMALPTASPERQLKHRRNIDVQIYSRGNGLWEVDAHITDVRSRDTQMSFGVLPAGQPI